MYNFFTAFIPKREVFMIETLKKTENKTDELKTVSVEKIGGFWNCLMKSVRKKALSKERWLV